MKPMKRETFSRVADRISQPTFADGDGGASDASGHMCSAHGCPMWGPISDGKRWCRFHFGEGGRRFDAITAALRRNLSLVDDVQRLRAKCASASATPDDRPALLAAEKALASAVRAAQ